MTRRLACRLSLLLVLAAFLVPAGRSSAAPAAQAALAVDSLDCWKVAWVAQLQCVATVSGGTGGYTVTWQPTPTSSGAYSATEFYMTAPCNPGRGAYTPAYVVVKDSSGAQAFDAMSVLCYPS
jgi:hypothetical protein